MARQQSGKAISVALAVVAVTALTLLSGVLHGRMSNRWGPTPDMLAAAARLDGIPSEFADWKMAAPGEMSETAREMLQCTGYICRTYENQITRERASVDVLVGPAGPISVHTPEVCYSSQDYARHGVRALVQFPRGDGTRDELWAVTFRSNDVRREWVRVYYAWSTGGRWSAPNDARFAFAGSPYLYKIQLETRLWAGADPNQSDPCRHFLQSFLPAVGDVLKETRAAE